MLILFLAIKDVTSKLKTCLELQLTALDLGNRGEMVWSAATQPGPLLSSTISAMELDDRGQFMKLIPSLNGKLYKFNGEVSLNLKHSM